MNLSGSLRYEDGKAADQISLAELLFLKNEVVNFKFYPPLRT